MRIFLVEDQKIILQGIQKMFSHFCSEEMYAFSDPQAALAQAPVLRPDAVYTDIVMEGMDGLTLIREIAQLLPECRFVIISGFADFMYARQAIDLGVDAYLLKPIERAALEDSYRKVSGGVRQPPGERESRRPSISEQTMRFIAGHCEQELSVAGVAAGVHLSPNYLSNVFRKETGMSVTEAIRSEQMKAAARLLRDTDMYLYEIAERMGYRDVKYFSMLFKEAHHMTPKSYRQKYREEDDHVPAEPD